LKLNEVIFNEWIKLIKNNGKDNLLQEKDGFTELDVTYRGLTRKKDRHFVGPVSYNIINLLCLAAINNLDKNSELTATEQLFGFKCNPLELCYFVTFEPTAVNIKEGHYVLIDGKYALKVSSMLKIGHSAATTIALLKGAQLKSNFVIPRRTDAT
jgi:hypothetical protein